MRPRERSGHPSSDARTSTAPAPPGPPTWPPASGPSPPPPPRTASSPCTCSLITSPAAPATAADPSLATNWNRSCPGPPPDAPAAPPATTATTDPTRNRAHHRDPPTRRTRLNPRRRRPLPPARTGSPITYLREAVVVASGYMRQNIIQEVWAEIFDTSQPVISGEDYLKVLS
jgi:hypothetical protein